MGFWEGVEVLPGAEFHERLVVSNGAVATGMADTTDQSRMRENRAKVPSIQPLRSWHIGRWENDSCRRRITTISA